MFVKIKAFISKTIATLDSVLFGEPACANTYRFPCKWVITGGVDIEAMDYEQAKAYMRSHKVTPELEDCICLNISPDVKNPVICICGCCKTPYIVSTDNPIEVCPCCGNGGVEEEF